MKKTTLSMTVQVQAKRQEADGVAGFTLVDPHGRALPTFTAGSHIDVQPEPGVLRQYSLCNQPGSTDSYQIAVLREPQSRGGSQAMHEAVDEGDLIQISAPRNHFELAPDAKRSLLLAGGIGITPILAMARQLHRDGAEFELHYSARSQAAMAFHDWLTSGPLSAQVQCYFDDQGSRLPIDQLVAQPHDGTHLYVCGPGGYIDFVMDRFRTAGWPEAQLHTEFFTAADIDTSNDGSFELVLARSGESYRIPADQTVAEVLLDNDVDLLTSCEQGICGTCITRVLEGIPEHRDRYMTEAEHAANDCFTPCCSRAKTERLVIDL